jgi:capsular polysaccharide biosynthesis protein
MTTTPQRGQAAPPVPDDDWDAEQEVDFRRYWTALATRWWLPVLGLVLGAIVGYAVSLGGSQVYKAQATIYLGQPYSVSGNVQLQSAQTNPSTVRTIANSQVLRAQLKKQCGIKPAVSTAAVAGNLAKLGQTPEVSITVQGAKPKKITCAANMIAHSVITDPAVAGYANQKITNFRSQIVADNKQITAINQSLGSATLASTDKLVLLQSLRPIQQDRIQAIGLLQQARQVEAPRIITHASAQKVTARSRRNSVVVAAVVGLIIGLLAALLWEPVAGRFGRRRPAV